MRVESTKMNANIKKRMNPFEFTSDVVNIFNFMDIYNYKSYIFLFIYFS